MENKKIFKTGYKYLNVMLDGGFELGERAVIEVRGERGEREKNALNLLLQLIINNNEFNLTTQYFYVADDPPSHDRALFMFFEVIVEHMLDKHFNNMDKKIVMLSIEGNQGIAPFITDFLKKHNVDLTFSTKVKIEMDVLQHPAYDKVVIQHYFEADPSTYLGAAKKTNVLRLQIVESIEESMSVRLSHFVKIMLVFDSHLNNLRIKNYINGDEIRIVNPSDNEEYPLPSNEYSTKTGETINSSELLNNLSGDKKDIIEEIYGLYDYQYLNEHSVNATPIDDRPFTLKFRTPKIHECRVKGEIESRIDNILIKLLKHDACKVVINN